MNNNFWTKITNFKILGKTIFSKEEICTEKNYEENEFKVYITQDYFNKEFDVKEEKNKDN